MREYFIKNDIQILSQLQNVVNSKVTNISRQSFRKAFKEIGLEFDYCLIEDIKRKIVSDKLIIIDSLGNQMLNCLVVLFTDHLLIRRIERSRDKDMAFDMRFNEVFNKCKLANQYLTKRQYKISLTYMYSNLPKRTQEDPFLLFSNTKNDDAEKVSIKKSDCIKFLISRERVIEQISSEIRKVSSINILTVNERDFVRIYNKCLTLLKELTLEDASCFTNKEAIVIK